MEEARLLDEYKSLIAILLSGGVTVVVGILSFVGKRWIDQVDVNIHELQEKDENLGREVAILQTRSSETNSRLDRIENKIDLLLNEKRNYRDN